MTVDIDPLVIDDLRERLSRRRLSRLDDDGERGISGPWLEELLEDWKGLNGTTFPHSTSGLTHLSANIDGQRVHLAMAEGRGPNPTPLLLCNGWPSSFYEYLDVLPLLTDPAAHGGTAQDAFTVVIPTMPGFGFSAPPPPGGLTAAQIGEMWHALMTEGLGFDRFVAHGSDLGAGVVPQLARAHPRSVAGIHLASPAVPLPPRPWSPAIELYAKEVETWAAEEGSYAHQHATKPDTIGVALQDSPAGLAAWIGEKVVAWSSPDPDGLPAFPRDLLLANPDPLLGNRDHRHLDAAVLEVPAHAKRCAAHRRSLIGSRRRSACSAGSGCHSPGCRESLPSGISRSPGGTTMKPADTSLQPPHRNSSPRPCGLPSVKREDDNAYDRGA